MSANLFDAAAERLAIDTGLPVSQARLRVANTDVEPFGPLFATVCDWCPEARASSAKHDAAYACECGRVYRDYAELIDEDPIVVETTADDAARFCPECEADLIGNDPHFVGCLADTD